MSANINKHNDKLEITYKVKGLNIIKYVVYIVMVIGPIYNLFKYVLPQNDEIISIIIKALLGGSLYIIIGVMVLYYVKQHRSTQNRKIVFDNKSRQILDDNVIYSYDDIKTIEVVYYNTYKNNLDEKVIDGTTMGNYLTTFVAKIDLENKKVIALKIGLRSTCKKIVKEVNEYIKEVR